LSEDGLNEEELKRKHDMEELTRDARTVVVTQLQVKTEEKDIQKFFQSVAKVKNVSILRDRFSGKSKGIAYVELKTLQDRDTALELSGKPFVFRNGKEGFPIMVKQSEAEKNFAHRQQKVQTAREQGRMGAGSVTRVESRKIVISNLHASINKVAVEELCSHFGRVRQIRLPEAKGVAYVEFDSSHMASRACSGLKDRILANQKLEVKISDDGAASHNQSWTLDDDVGGRSGRGGGVELSSTDRVSLMSKLAGGAASEMISNLMANTAKKSQENNVSSSETRYLLIKNMFNPAEETQVGWAFDIKAETEEECANFGKVVSCQVDEKDPRGIVKVVFEDIAGARKAFSALNGRWFAKRMVQCEYLRV